MFVLSYSTLHLLTIQAGIISPEQYRKIKMSFFQSVKKIAITEKCKIGWHAGEYTNIEDQPECHLEKTCPDCSKHITKISHKYNKWRYIKALDSTQVRACTYCGKEEKRELLIAVHQ